MPIEISQIRELADKIFDKVNAYREHLHSNPELSYKEYNTAKFVSEKLADIGIESTSIGGTGVMALISGEQHGDNDKCIALRADLDALPIQEENEVSYKSKNDGVMHACGLIGSNKLLEIWGCQLEIWTGYSPHIFYWSLFRF